VAHRGKPLPVLRSTKHDKVFTYGSGRRWRLATARRFGPSLASMSASSGAPLVKMKAPKGAVVFGNPSGTVDSALAAAYRCGGELTWWLGFQYLWIRIHHRTGTIYRAFCTES
jgi:hypothetical protein